MPNITQIGQRLYHSEMKNGDIFGLQIQVNKYLSLKYDFNRVNNHLMV